MKTSSLRYYSIYLAWLVALIATLVSLYFSVLHKISICDLCWYQRICMYPLVIILGIAAYREDKHISIYTLPLAVIGLLLSAYQYLEQMIPGFFPLHLCGVMENCARIDWMVAGFVTISFLNILANLLIIFFLWISSHS